MERATWCFVVGTALALAGCAGGGITYGSYVDSRYDYSHVELAASDAPVPVLVKGNPFPLPPAQFADGLVAAMQEKNFSPRIRFATVAPPGRRYAYRVIMAFGGLPPGANDLCKTPDVAITPASPGRLDAKAFFCYDDLLLTYAAGWLGGIDSMQDPRFERIIAQLVQELFPINDYLLKIDD